MKKIFVLIFIFVTVTASAQNIPTDDTTALPTITEPGKPIGKIIEKMMNKDGGTLVSEDGTVELIIPAGALSKKTTMSIQTVTNTFQNGNGLAYRLEPSGIQFQQPVQIVFHYDPEESEDSAQLLMGIAMQDDSGQWYGLNQFTLDTVAKTISGNIDHFSIWATFDKLKLITLTREYRLKVGRSTPIAIEGVFVDKKEMKSLGLSKLLTMKKPPLMVEWYVDGVLGGNNVVGTMDKSYFADKTAATSHNLYRAPDKVPYFNPVTITAGLVWMIDTKDGWFRGYKYLTTKILIYDNAYEVKMESSAEEDAGSVGGTYTYYDKGSFVVSLDPEVKIVEKRNRNVPDKMDYKGKCKVKQLKPGSGYINIIGAENIKVIPPASPKDNYWIEIDFIYSPMIMPLLKLTCPPVVKGNEYIVTNEAPRSFAARLLRAYPHTVKFEVKSGKAVILLVDLGRTYFKMTVEQLPDD